VLALAAPLSTPLATPLAAQTVSNPGFELAGAEPFLPRSWATGGAGAHEVVWDSATARRGKRSLRLGGAATATQSVPACPLRGRLVHLTGFIRTERVDSGFAALWLRQEGAGGGTLSLENSRRLNRTREWARYEIVAEVARDAERISFGATMTGTGAAWFDDLSLTSYPVEGPPGAAGGAAVPVATDCVVVPPSSAAVAYLDDALTLIRTRALFRDSVDWTDARRSALDRMIGAQDPDDAYAALEFLLERLGDDHSLLIAAGEIAAMRTLTMEEAIVGDPPRGEWLPGRIGYLTVPGFIGGGPEAAQSFAALIQRTIADLDARRPCGWIVDLRGNVGGNMWPMLAGLGPVLGEGPSGFIVADSARSGWDYLDGAARLGGATVVSVPVPYRLASGRPPVAVLTGRITASSGEAMAIAFRGREGARSFGQPTRGLSTSTLSMKLSDGAVMALATALFADRTGRTYGAQVEPDELVPSDIAAGAEDQASPDQASGDRATARAAAWLRDQPACGAPTR